jgi:UDP-glucose 4-epimerase
MKALVTGGAGFIGTNLIKRLLKDGHEVVSVDNYSTGKKENHQEGCQYHDFDLSSSHTLGIYVDHGSYPSWRDDEYDVIFHLAALPRIQPSFEDPIKTFNSNVVSTLHILEYARKKNEKERWANKIRIVYADSSSVHGNKYVNPYTFTKYNGAELCRMYSEIYELPVSICRFYNVYGPYQETEGEYCTVVGIFERQYQNGEPLTITWDGEQRRDFTHVDDIVDGLVRSGDEYFKVCEEFELGTGENCSINELASWFGEDYPCDSLPKRDGEMRESLCTDTHAHELLDWKPRKDLENYIRDFIETNK